MSKYWPYCAAKSDGEIITTYLDSRTALACWSLIVFFSSLSFKITRFKGVGFFCFGVSRTFGFFLLPDCACFSISCELYSRLSNFFCSSWISAYSKSAFCWARKAFLPWRRFSSASELSQSVSVSTSPFVGFNFVRGKWKIFRLNKTNLGPKRDWCCYSVGLWVFDYNWAVNSFFVFLMCFVILSEPLTGRDIYHLTVLVVLASSSQSHCRDRSFVRSFRVNFQELVLPTTHFRSTYSAEKSALIFTATQY